MVDFFGTKMRKVSLISLRLFFTLLLFIATARARSIDVERIEDWVEEIERDIHLDSPESVESFEALFERTLSADERIDVLTQHLEVIRRRAQSGMSWPDPELRIGFDRDDSRDREEGEVAIRFKMPKRANKKRLAGIEKIDTNWTRERIEIHKRKLRVELKELLVSGSFSRARLLLGIERLRSLLGFELKMHELETAGRGLAIERVRVGIEIAELLERLNKTYAEYEGVLLRMSHLGIDLSACRRAVNASAADSWDLPLFPEYGAVLSAAAKNSESVRTIDRELALLSESLKLSGRKWLPQASFAQIGWSDISGLGADETGGEWGVRAGFELNIFDDNDAKLLSALRGESERKKSLALRETREGIDSLWQDLTLQAKLAERSAIAGEGLIENLGTQLLESEKEGIDPVELWKVRRLYFDLEGERLKRKAALFGLLGKFENAIGESFFKIVN